MSLVFEQIRCGGDRNFGYLLGDRAARRAVLVDPSYAPQTFVERAADQGLTVSHIINTHGHPDHTNGNTKAAELTGARVAAHSTLPVAVDDALADRQKLTVGSLTLEFLHTPGHAADHLVVYEASHGILITGDLLFVGKVGGTKTDEDARTEWASLQRLLQAIPDHCTVWPGHDYGARPSSTIGLEKQSNPFLRCRDLTEFLALKRDWAAYKKQLGLR